MADFEKAFQYVMRHEDSRLSGVITPEPNGGEARFGVNSVAHPEAIRQGFYEMSRDAALQWAEDLFKYDYWSPCAGYSLADQDVANKVADLAFNSGVREAGILLQQAIIGVKGKVLALDGIVGAHTVAAANSIEPEILLARLRDVARNFYVHLAGANPKFRNDLPGWLRRLDS